MVAWAPEESSDMHCDALELSPRSISKPQISITSVLCTSMFTVSPSDFPLPFQPLPVAAPSSSLQDPSLLLPFLDSVNWSLDS